MRARPIPPQCRESRKWFRDFAKRQGNPRVFAPFTGQDMPLFDACAHLIEMYSRGDTEGRLAVIGALRALVTVMSPHVRRCVRDMIPAVMDWCHVEEIWTQVEASLEAFARFDAQERGRDARFIAGIKALAEGKEDTTAELPAGGAP